MHCTPISYEAETCDSLKYIYIYILYKMNVKFIKVISKK